jgi:glyoxylase-like metal-dependent hydrolase (beta-lactamase superfamily II)
MLHTEDFGDVTRLVLSTRVSRAVGYSVSVYLVRGMAVDLGFPAVEQDIVAMLAQVQPAGVLLTHYHEDHSGNAELAARAGLPLAVSDATLAHLRAATPLALYRRVIWGTPPPFVSPITRFGSDVLRLVPAPGHSDDHHVVWDAERETLFSGDLFLGVKVRLAHPSENPRQLARSVRAAAALRPTRMFDAHRGPIAHPVEALSAKANWLDETIGEIERGIAKGWPDRVIARTVLGREEATAYVSRGAMSKENFVRAVRRSGDCSPSSA